MSISSRVHLVATTAATLFLSLALALPAIASDAYRFEMIVFERPSSASSEQLQRTGEGHEPRQTTAPLASRAVDQRKLGNISYTLKRRGARVLEHVAWVQTPGGRNSNTWYRIGDGRLEGAIRVTRGRFLHVDADLLLHDLDGEQPIHVQLYRRMRSDELHYLDHPRVGIVIRADRVAVEPSPDPTGGGDATAGEPRPAEPQSPPRPS
jgi:hypothetical protein